MKKARIINGVCWGVAALVIIATSCKVWSEQDCSAVSLLAAVIFYGGSSAALWFTVDQRIQGK